MKIPFIFAISSTSLSELADIIEGAVYYPAGAITGVNYPTLVVNGFRYMVNILCTGITLDEKSIAADDTWTLVWILPEKDDFDESTKLFRKATKSKIEKQALKDKDKDKDKSKNISLGPWCLDEVANKFPAIADQYLRNEAGELRCPHIFAGDSLPEITAKCKYTPTNEDCIADVKAKYEDVVAKYIAVDEKLVEEEEKEVVKDVGGEIIK